MSKQSELDEIINSAYEGEVSWTHDQLDGTSALDDAIKGIEDEKARTKQSLLDWHNKQVLEMLKDEQHDEVAFKYMGLKKLKESSNEHTR